MLYAQIPDPIRVIDTAAAAGWMPVVLVFILICFLLAAGVMMRWIIKSMDERQNEATLREDRMSKRIAELEDFVRLTLTKMISDYATLLIDNRVAYNKLSDALDKRTCLMTSDHQVKVIDVIADTVAEKVVATIHTKVIK